jgi:hypothetical protein
MKACWSLDLRLVLDLMKYTKVADALSSIRT